MPRWVSWGAGADGQLGNERNEDAVLTPVWIEFPENETEPTALSVCGGGAHTMAFRPGEETLFVFGANQKGQLGLHPSDNPAIYQIEKISLPFQVITVTLGWVGTCRNGREYRWNH